MDLKQIEYFVRVVELGSFTKAANLLGLAQPSLSRQIRLLEVELGEHLLYRTGRGVTPTDAGNCLLSHGYTILAEVRATRQHIQDLKSAPDGHVAIGLTTSVAQELTPRLVNAFREAFPGGMITVTEGLSANLREWLLEGRIDIALLYMAEPTAKLMLETLFREELVLVCGSQTAAPPEQIRLDELSNYPLVLPCMPNGIRMLVEAKCRMHDVPLSIAAEVNSLQSMLTVVQTSKDRYSIVAERVAHDGMQAGLLHIARIHSPAILNTLSLATARHRPESRLQRGAKQLLHELVLSPGGSAPTT
jgi:LysR family nitrogen assimilation transcriptional regulator